jgi:hypothetical protein
MKKILLRTVAIVCMALLYCNSPVMAQSVRYNFVPGTDFSKFKTYKWALVKDGSYPNQILDTQIIHAIDSELASKGLRKSEEEKVDLYVTYQVAVNQEKQWDTYGGGIGMGWGWYGGGMQTTTSSTINVGTLVVDIYDAPTNKQVWRGDATKTLNPSKNPEKTLKNLQKAVAKMMKNYPPPAKK